MWNCGTVRKVLNAINTSSKLSNMFRSICEINNEKHNVLLNYNHVRWLSFDSSVQRLCELNDYVVSALTVKHKDLSQKLQSNYVKGSILFLKNFLPRISSFNKQLQKSNLTIIVETVLIVDKLKKHRKKPCDFLDNLADTTSKLKLN